MIVCGRFRYIRASHKNTSSVRVDSHKNLTLRQSLPHLTILPWEALPYGGGAPPPYGRASRAQATCPGSFMPYHWPSCQEVRSGDGLGRRFADLHTYGQLPENRLRTVELP